jgi:hypothetical protein
VLFRDFLDDFVLNQVLVELSERRVGLNEDTIFRASLNRVLLNIQRVKLELIYNRFYSSYTH